MVFVMLAGGADGAEEVPMNAVEIADAISELAAEPYDAASFPFAFLEAFGNKPAVLAKLKNGASNSSDVKAG
ncbi:MAG: hypothetical protein PSN37_04240, partial [Alphaproteobacteria bacterium]|nr:hypothetical protein [Alphaproteobacteria bacterium]